MKTKNVALTMKIDGSYRLNELKMKETDLTLLLELLGFEITPCQNKWEFFGKCLKSIAQTTPSEFHSVFTDFKGFDQTTKDQYRFAAAHQRLVTMPLTNN